MHRPAAYRPCPIPCMTHREYDRWRALNAECAADERATDTCDDCWWAHSERGCDRSPTVRLRRRGLVYAQAVLSLTEAKSA